jgi:hypothetical protein
VTGHARELIRIGQAARLVASRAVGGESREHPLKVCPHCSLASRTDSETCPNCGKSYVRGRPSLRWSWWFAIPIVAAAFLIGYFGISQLIDGDEDGITGGPDPGWLFCFRGDQLESSAPLPE